MKHLIVLIFLGIVIESLMMVVVVGAQRSNSDNDYENPFSTTLQTVEEVTIAAYRRPATGNFNGRYKKVLKVKKNGNVESLPLGKRLNRLPNSEDSSVSASSNKNSFTVNSFDDNDEYFSRRRAQFLFRQRVGK